MILRFKQTKAFKDRRNVLPLACRKLIFPRISNEKVSFLKLKKNFLEEKALSETDATFTSAKSVVSNFHVGQTSQTNIRNGFPKDKTVTVFIILQLVSLKIEHFFPTLFW